MWVQHPMNSRSGFGITNRLCLLQDYVRISRAFLIRLNTGCLTLNSLSSKKLLMKVKITLIGVYSQGKLYGAPSCVLFIPLALTNNQSLTQKIELGSANKFHVFLISFMYFLAIF